MSTDLAVANEVYEPAVQYYLAELFVAFNRALDRGWKPARALEVARGLVLMLLPDPDAPNDLTVNHRGHPYHHAATRYPALSAVQHFYAADEALDRLREEAAIHYTPEALRE